MCVYIYKGDGIYTQHYIFDIVLGYVVHDNETVWDIGGIFEIMELPLPGNLW